MFEGSDNVVDVRGGGNLAYPQDCRRRKVAVSSASYCGRQGQHRILGSPSRAMKGVVSERLQGVREGFHKIRT